MNDLDDLLFHPGHMWLRLSDGAIGITDHAQGELGPIIFIQLPVSGDRIVQGEALGQIETAKTIADLIAPVTGVIVEVNDRLLPDPELPNRNPYTEGWILRLDGTSLDGSDNLITASAYRQLVTSD